MLERIVYVSRVAAGGRPDMVYAIIRTAHARNAAAGLTGALIVLDGWFAQLLEGPPAPLASSFARIAADPRHEALELRIRMPALARLFPGQALALRHRACLDADLLADFDYRPGFPVEIFPVDVLTEFVIRACRQGATRGVRRPAERPGAGPSGTPAKGWTTEAGLSKDGFGSRMRHWVPRG